jgi:hypothetical protein
MPSPIDAMIAKIVISRMAKFLPAGATDKQSSRMQNAIWRKRFIAAEVPDGCLHPDADSILFLSPHWPVIGAIEPLEHEFGVNVMTALQAIVWDALRRVGVNDRIEGYGRLFLQF